MSKVNFTLTQERLIEVLNYDPSTGLFARRFAKTNKVKSMVGVWQAGSLTNTGYRSIRVDGVPYQAHRLAWLYMTGEWPDGQIDHKNGVRSDNRFDNLRDVTVAENQLNLSKTNQNSVSGIRGAHWNRSRGKFQSQLEIGGKRIYIGLFDTAEEASSAYYEARKRHGVESIRD